MTNSQTALNVLLVEDHEADARLVEEALADCKMQVNLDAVGDGDEAIKYIAQEGKYTGKSRPNLIILDLNMPRKDGHEFLDEMHSYLKGEDIPVILLTVSDNPNDINKAMDTHMNYYMSKPVNAGKLQQVLKAINELWSPTNCCGH